MAAEYARLTEAQRAEFAAQVGQIDGLRVLAIVRRALAGLNAKCSAPQAAGQT